MLSESSSRSPAAVPVDVYMDLTPGVCFPTEVGQFQLPSVVDEQILRFQVPVEDLPLVTVGETTQQLEHENLQDEQTGITHVWPTHSPAGCPAM